MKDQSQVRRRFLGRLTSAIAVAGASLSFPRLAHAAEPAVELEVHELDKWIAAMTGEYKLALDAVTPKGVGELTQYASTYMMLNAGVYNIAPARTNLIVIVRNMAAAFGFGNEAWAMHALGEHAPFTDSRTGAPSVRNTAAGALGSLVAQGATIAVCGMATQYYASLIATKQNISVADARKSLEDRLLPGARIVPSGITAVDRCQRHRFSYAYVG
jgi:intracellular sulfur oxidation DsrE/DsrF family protein